jgi:hypothetical protein
MFIRLRLVSRWAGSHLPPSESVERAARTCWAFTPFQQHAIRSSFRVRLSGGRISSFSHDVVAAHVPIR